MRRWLIPVLILALVIISALSPLAGTVWLTPAEVLSAVSGTHVDLARLISMEIRLPRLILAILIGGILGLSGATRAVPTATAWDLGQRSAQLLVDDYLQREGEYPKAMALSAWGTANMRTGGDDIAQALALMSVRPRWDFTSGRVIGFEVMKPVEVGRPRVDVTFRVSGFFRDAFPEQIDLIDSAARAVMALDEPEEDNPAAARHRRKTAKWVDQGEDAKTAARRAGHRVFGSKPGAYGAGLQAMIDEKIWHDRADLANVYLDWGGYAYDAGVMLAQLQE